MNTVVDSMRQEFYEHTVVDSMRQEFYEHCC